jgi:hypothetical protein
MVITMLGSFLFLAPKTNKWGDKMTAGIYRNISQFFHGENDVLNRRCCHVDGIFSNYQPK